MLVLTPLHPELLSKSLAIVHYLWLEAGLGMPFPFEFPKFACCCPPPPPEGDELVEDEGTWHEQSSVFVSQSEQYMQTS